MGKKADRCTHEDIDAETQVRNSVLLKWSCDRTVWRSVIDENYMGAWLTSMWVDVWGEREKLRLVLRFLSQAIGRNERFLYCFSCSVTQSCPTLCRSIDCSTASFPVLRYLLEFAQTHVHWCRPTVSSYIAPFSSFPQSFPASGSFPVSQLFTSGGQSIGASALASVLPMNIQGWFPLESTGLISLLSKGLLQHHSSKASILQCSAFLVVQLSHPYMTTGKTIALSLWTYVGKVVSLLFKMLYGFAIAFLPRSKHLLISWL